MVDKIMFTHKRSWHTDRGMDIAQNKRTFSILVSCRALQTLKQGCRSSLIVYPSGYTKLIECGSGSRFRSGLRQDPGQKNYQIFQKSKILLIFKSEPRP